MQLNRSLHVFTCVLLSLLLFTACSKKAEETETTAKKETQSVDTSPEATTPVASINGFTISNVELDKELTRIQQRFYTSANMSDAQKNQVKGEILKILINNELFYQASQELEISPTDEEIDLGLKSALEQYPNTDAFNNTFTREDIIKKIAVEKFISEAFSDKTIITDEQANSYYQENIADFTRPEQVFTSQIHVPFTAQSDQAQKQQALETINNIQEQLKAGKAFAELAEQYNEGKQKLPGGQLGYIVRGQLDPVLETALFALEENQFSDVIETANGYYIVTISDKKPLYVFPFDEISEKLKAYLKQKEVQKKIDTFITTQRETAKIEIFL
nr:peptidyl-prolyl cis-trans isomerase [Desulfobulbaceae bacterium]